MYDKHDRGVFINVLAKIPTQQRDRIINAVILKILQTQRHHDYIVDFLSAICSMRSESCPALIAMIEHMFWYEGYINNNIIDIVTSHKSFITNNATRADLSIVYFPDHMKPFYTSLRGLPVVIKHLRHFRTMRMRTETSLFHYYCKYAIRMLGNTIYDNVFAYWLHQDAQYIKNYITFIVFAATHADSVMISELNQHIDTFISFILRQRTQRRVSNNTIKVLRALIYNGINIYAVSDGVNMVSALRDCYDVRMSGLVDVFGA
jgi:hypothetical protein